MSLAHLKNPVRYWLGKKHTDEYKKRMSISTSGKILTEEHRRRISDALKGRRIDWGDRISKSKKGKIVLKRRDEKHPFWKGINVGYGSLHQWVSRRLGKPDNCEHCKKIGLSGKTINWANKSKRYLRDINDWIRLCVSCHRKFDRVQRVERNN